MKAKKSIVVFILILIVLVLLILVYIPITIFVLFQAIMCTMAGLDLNEKLIKKIFQPINYFLNLITKMDNGKH